MMLTTNPFEQYRQQGVYTASPAELVVMLYDGCVRQLKVSILALEDRNTDVANTAMLKAQAIVQELNRSLDRQYELSGGLRRIYDFVDETIIGAISSRDADALRPLVEIMADLQDTWAQVARQHRTTSIAVDE